MVGIPRVSNFRLLMGAGVLAAVLLGMPATAAAQDLYIKSFNIGVSGTTVTYEVEACNRGSSTTKRFDLEIYYNLTSSPGCNTYQSQTYTFSSGLASGKCVKRTFYRYSASSGTQYGWARVDADCTVGETNESNNNYYRRYTVGASVPDLYVSSFTVSTSSAGTTTYKATVCNGGSSTRTSFDLEIYYNLSTAPGCTTIQSQTYVFSTGLASKACTTKSFTRTGVATGTYTAWARADADCKVSESNELNNNRYYVHSVKPSKPDLYLTSFSTTVSGTSVTYKATVCNGGATTTTSFDVEFYYDRSSAPGCTSYASRDEPVSGGLAAGKCVTKTYTRTSAASGSYTAWARADADCKVSESNESNNNRYSVYKVGPSLPDLRISSFKATVSGTTVTYSATVCNGGASTTKGSYLEIYYNRTTAPDCYTVNSRSAYISSLAAGKCTTKVFTRTGASSGSYTAWARADANCAITEGKETNNNAYAKYTIGKPDLYVKTFNVATSGTSATYQVTVCNGGTSTKTSFRIAYYYNTTSTPGCSTTASGYYTSTSGLASGSCTTRTFTRTGLTYGTYKAWARADSSCSVTESTETNNTTSKSYIVGPTVPNLYVKTFTASVSGTSVNYTAVICNSGMSTTSAFDLEIYYHRVSSPGCTSSESRNYKVSSGLAYGKCLTKVFSRTGVASGNYTAWARVDADCQVTESSETDNNKSAPYVVGTTAKPELYVSNFDVTVSGTTATYKVTVCNAGSKTSAFDLAVFYNQNSAPKCGATADQKYTVSAGLDKGKCTTQSFTRPGVSAGTFNAWAFADSGCKVTETTETNNTTSKSYTVAQTKADLYISTMTVVPSTTQLTVEFTVCNGGKAAAAASVVGFFANRSKAPACTDRPDITTNIGTLNPSSCETKKTAYTAGAAGPYVAWALADTQCAVTESNENNNALPKAYVVPSPPVDQGVQTDLEVVPDGRMPPDQGMPDAEQNEEDAGAQVDGGYVEVDKGGTTKTDIGTVIPGGDDDGCGCRVSGPADSPTLPAPLAYALLLGVMVLIRRRRK